DRHAVWKGETAGNCSNGAVGRQQRNNARTVVDVGVAAAIHDDLIPHLIGYSAQVGVRNQGPVSFASHYAIFTAGYDQQAAVSKPVETKRQAEGSVHDDVFVSGEIDRQNLLRAPVRQPESTVVPSRRFTHRKAGDENVHVLLAPLLMT